MAERNMVGLTQGIRVRLIDDLVFVYRGTRLTGYGLLEFEKTRVDWLKSPSEDPHVREAAETAALGMRWRRMRHPPSSSTIMAAS